MTKKIILLSSLGAVALAGGAAFAAQGGALSGGPMKRIDANGDGNVTRAEVTAHVEKRFARADANGDGSITEADRTARMEARGERRFERLDADKNGSISRAEWDAGIDARAERREARGHHGGRHHARMMRAGFHARMADTNKDGTVTKAEAQAAALAMFDRVDTNKDGTITAAEREAAHAAWKARRES